MSVDSTETRSYSHKKETRSNIPTVGLGSDGNIPDIQKKEYYYNPHFQPILRFDTERNTFLPPRAITLLQEAQKRKMTEKEITELVDAFHQPWLEWTNKREEGYSFIGDPVPLFIHDQISAESIIETAKRNVTSPSLFADSQLKYREAIKFYEHKIPWTNRLILGDNRFVMDSLANRDGLAGEVQMIYVDPPYGIDFNSNFQTEVFKTNTGSSNSEKDMTREMGQVKAYNDTWKLGVHTYLSYLRQRFVVARELLKDSGSIFVQISDKNVHWVRCVLDEVFKSENFVAQICYKTTSGRHAKKIDRVSNYILWFAKNIENVKYHNLFVDKFDSDEVKIRRGDLQSQGESSTGSYTVEFQGKQYQSRPGRHWTTTEKGMFRLIQAERVLGSEKTISYKRLTTDYPVASVPDVWTDVSGGATGKIYVVQTNDKIVERCLLMSTDPGDLVLDPTCGSGTTAYVAERWGRRWITIDTSRISITLARNRLLTATYPYYRLKNELEGIGGGFVLETAPHIQLNEIANNEQLDPIFAKHEPILTGKLATLNDALKQVTPEIRQELQQKLAAKKKKDVTDADYRRWILPETEWEEWEVPFDTDPAWPQALQDALQAYRKAWHSKMDEVNSSIAASSKQENLVDRPIVEKETLRVSGSFTIESMQPAAQSLGININSSEYDMQSENAQAYLDQLYLLIKKGGVWFGNENNKFKRLNKVSGDMFHAEGNFEKDSREVGIVFGPKYGMITALQVEKCFREARRQYEVLLFAGLEFEAEAQAIIQDGHPSLETFDARIAPDVVMGGLIKQKKSDRIFTVVGKPQIELKKDNEHFTVTMQGLDTYNPFENKAEFTKADKVAAWFLDSNYNGRIFCPTQSFFPDITAWKNIARSLKTEINEDVWDTFSGCKSLPFEAGEHSCAAVKVIDRYGHELMSVHKLKN